MELRCDCRSTNISERLDLNIDDIYLLRWMAISSTENAQCGVLAPCLDHLLKHRFNPMLHCPRVIMTTVAYSEYFWR